MKYILLKFGLIIILLSSCNLLPQPDMFRLNAGSRIEEQVSGLKMCPLDKVDVYGDNALTIYDGGRVGLCSRFSQTTQLYADFTVVIKEGNGVTFYFKNITDKFEEGKHPFISFDYTTDGCRVFENGATIRTVDSIKANLQEPARIKLYNNGKVVNIIVNCDTLFYGRTETPATEYIIIETKKSTKANISGIVFSDTNKD